MIGQIASDFKLNNSLGEPVILSSVFAEKNVVLVFYPKDFTPGCIRQLSEIKDNYSRFERANTAVLGINADTVESHQRFRKELALPFELLEDKNFRVARAYNCVKPDGSGIVRTVIGIAKGGQIVFYERGTPKVSEVLKSLRRANKNRAEKFGGKKQ